MNPKLARNLRGCYLFDVADDNGCSVCGRNGATLRSFVESCSKLMGNMDS